VLRQHWPCVPIFDDVRTLTKEKLLDHGVGSLLRGCGQIGQDGVAAGSEEGEASYLNR
jgi:hypothetical protein